MDELDSFSIKLFAKYIAAPVHHIVTLSIIQKKFPTSWKLTTLIPLHKKSSQLDPKNYRPVAILSPLSKILEKTVFRQIYDYFSNNRIFHPSLHGYKQHRSTHTALLQMYDHWGRSASRGCVSGVVFLDLSAAFEAEDIWSGSGISVPGFSATCKTDIRLSGLIMSSVILSTTVLASPKAATLVLYFS